MSRAPERFQSLERIRQQLIAEGRSASFEWIALLTQRQIRLVCWTIGLELHRPISHVRDLQLGILRKLVLEPKGELVNVRDDKVIADIVEPAPNVGRKTA